MLQSWSSTSAPGAGKAWDDVVVLFRALGGTIENIRPAQDENGGLFVIDPSMPVLLQVPEPLLFPAADVEFVGGRPELAESAPAGPAERKFFRAYQEALASSGAATPFKGDGFVAALDALPAETRSLLGSEFGMGELLEGDPSQRTHKWHLQRRSISWHGKDVLAPFLELGDEAPEGLAWRADQRGYMLLEGRAENEIPINRGPRDAFGMFRKFGLAQPRLQAFSLPLSLAVERQIRIERYLGAHDWRGRIPVPRVTASDGPVTLSYLMLGSTKSPRMSRGIFRALLSPYGLQDSDEAFDWVLFANRGRFLSLLRTLEGASGRMVTMLRRMARYQLENMAHCIGTRDL